MSAPAFIRSGAAPLHEEERALIRVGTLGQEAPWRQGLLHDRPNDVLIWITRGQGRVILNGVRRGVGTHNALFLPAGTLISVEMGPQSLGLMVQSPAGLTARLPEAPQHLRVRDSLAQAELTGTIEAMQRELSKARPLVQDALEAHVQLIAVWLHRQIAEGVADSHKDSAGQRIVRQYAQALVRDFRSDLGIAGYAAALGVTATHLSRVCREACGKSAAEMLAERKLHEARRLLDLPQPPVGRIAGMLGFHSAPYFTRFIRNHTGQSPTELRRGDKRLTSRSHAHR